MEKDDLSESRISFPEPKIEKVEGKLKAELEERLGMKICPLTLRYIYEECGPFGIDLIFYECQKGGKTDPRDIEPRPCSLEYAVYCPAYKRLKENAVNS